MAAGRDDDGVRRDELAARRSERAAERAAANIAVARRTLEQGAAELVAQARERGHWWIDLGLCRAITASGQGCKAPATAEDGWCGAHRAVAERKARRADAEARRKPPGAKTPDGATAGRQRPQDRPFEGQCSGTNAAGRQCRLPALPGADRCQNHPRA